VRRDYQIKRMEARTRARARIRGVNLIPLLDIFTILLLFFLVQTGDPTETLPVLEHLRLPFSQAQQPPHRELLVAIDADNVMLEGRPVARVADVAAAESDLVPGLAQALDDYLAQARAAATGPEGEAIARLRGTVTIMGDREIPFAVLRKVMFTCAARHFGHISLAVQPPEKPSEG
jgi:biopolymer transport protein TolR